MKTSNYKIDEQNRYQSVSLNTKTESKKSNDKNSSPSNCYEDSFEYIPEKKVVSYKYYSPLPKKKCERKKLNAFTCPQCEKYYADLPEERLQLSSRHRGNLRPRTPEHFRDLDFPNIEIEIENYKIKPLSKNKYYSP